MSGQAPAAQPDSLMISVSEDVHWSGRLYLSGARPGTDDPQWECDHFHPTPDEAQACSAAEKARRSFRSAYARLIYGPAVSEWLLQALHDLDPDWAQIEAQLDGKLHGPVIQEICSKLYSAYCDGFNSYPNYPNAMDPCSRRA